MRWFLWYGKEVSLFGNHKEPSGWIKDWGELPLCHDGEDY